MTAYLSFRTRSDCFGIGDILNFLALNAAFGPYGVDLVEDTAGDAIVQIEIADTSAAGSAADGVLECTVAGSITLVTGWSWYTRPDPSAIGADQYDFETIVMHELGHAIGLGHSGDTGSVMYAYLAPGQTRRVVTTQDLSVLDTAAGSTPEPLTAAPWHDRSAPPTPIHAFSGLVVAATTGISARDGTDLTIMPALVPPRLALDACSASDLFSSWAAKPIAVTLAFEAINSGTAAESDLVQELSLPTVPNSESQFYTGSQTPVWEPLA